MPSPSRSRCEPSPGSPTRTGAAPASRAAVQFLYCVDQFEDPEEPEPAEPFEPDDSEEPSGFAGFFVSCAGVTLSPSPGAGQDESSENAGCSSQTVSTRSIAVFSASTTQSPYLCLTAICRATYSQRWLLFGGSQVAASPSPFCLLRCELT